MGKRAKKGEKREKIRGKRGKGGEKGKIMGKWENPLKGKGQKNLSFFFLSTNEIISALPGGIDNFFLP